MIGLITEPNVKGKAILIHDGNLYVIDACGFYRGQEVAFDISTAVRVESHMKAIADILEPTINFVKKIW